ncbi:hypothetical protein [Geomonas ferrireducens]|uniref:hypothetical protein n=1 Tax=Geomonas ferrireducens TaxID=2570227 RepID=UPI0010A8C6F2|nr:hypothetical protein [Geomonas ferrireducens]
MSIRIQIGAQERDLRQADEHWIIDLIKDQQHDLGDVCVQVIIESRDIHLRLRSPGCPSSGGGGGLQANEIELRILDLWQQHVGREKKHLGGGEVVAFVKALQRIL